MRTSCPSCGKVFDVPDTQAHRVLKCICKNLFKATPMGEEPGTIATPPSENKEAEDFELKVQRGAYAEDDESTADSSNVSSISGNDLENYLTNLKKGKEESATQISERPAPASSSRRMPSTDSIEMGESRVEKPKKSETLKSSAVADEILAEPSAEFHSPSRARQDAKKLIKKSQPENLWKRFESLSIGYQIGILGLIAIPVAIIAISLSSEEKQIERMDPSIARLLTPQPPVVAPKAPQIPKAEPKKIPVAPKKEENHLYVTMRESSFQGDFENVIRIGSSKLATLSPEEKALYFEAQIARAGKERTRVLEIKDEIQNQIGTSSDPVYQRSLSVALLRSAKETSQLSKPLEILKSLSMTRGRDPLVFAYLGMIYEKYERHDLAHASWDQALTIQPNFVWLLQRREQSFRGFKDYKNAVLMAERLTKIQGFESDGYQRLAEISRLKGEDANVIKNLRLALKTKENPALRLKIAKSLKGQPTEAMKELQTALNAANTDYIRADILSEMGAIRCAQKDYVAGIGFLRRALKELPNHAAAYLERARCERVGGELKKAIDAYESALKFNQNSSEVWAEYGASLLMDNKLKAAGAALQRSLSIEETDEAHLEMAKLQLKQNRLPEALSHARKAFKMNPKNARAKTLVAELSK